MAPESIEERLVAIETRLEGIHGVLSEIKGSLDHYVTYAEFKPIRNGFYGVCAAAGLAIIGAVNKILFK